MKPTDKKTAEFTPPSQKKPIMYCPRCFRAGDDVGDCGDTMLGCPPPREVDPQKMVVLECLPCAKTIAVAVVDIMRGKLPSGAYCKGDCSPENCKAHLKTKL